jgi:hypothetical protein
MPKETSHWHETGVLVVYSLPLVFSRLVQRYCIVLGPITAMGKYGATYLAAGGLGEHSARSAFSPSLAYSFRLALLQPTRRSTSS